MPRLTARYRHRPDPDEEKTGVRIGFPPWPSFVVCSWFSRINWIRRNSNVARVSAAHPGAFVGLINAFGCWVAPYRRTHASAVLRDIWVHAAPGALRLPGLQRHSERPGQICIQATEGGWTLVLNRKQMRCSFDTSRYEMAAGVGFPITPCRSRIERRSSILGKRTTFADDAAVPAALAQGLALQFVQIVIACLPVPLLGAGRHHGALITKGELQTAVFATGRLTCSNGLVAGVLRGAAVHGPAHDRGGQQGSESDFRPGPRSLCGLGSLGSIGSAATAA